MTTQPKSLGSVSVRATRRGQLGHRIIDPGEVFSCPVEDLALEEDHGGHHHGGSGWMVLIYQDDLLALLPKDEAALWQRRRSVATTLATNPTSKTLRDAHQAVHKELVALRAARNPMPPLTELKPQTMETPHAIA